MVSLHVVRQVFSSMEFLGWYTIGDSPSPEDAAFHEQLCSDRENTLLLQLNTSARTNQVGMFGVTKKCLNMSCILDICMLCSPNIPLAAACECV